MKKYLKLFYLYGRISFMRQMAYRPSLWLALTAKMARVFVLLLFFDFLYLYTNALASWTHEQILVLVACYFTIEFIYGITFHRNLLYWFPNQLRKGDFDFTLVKPVVPLFHTSFQAFDFFDLFSTAPVVFLWIYIFKTTEVSWPMVPLVLFFIILGLVFMYGFTLLIASTAFWTIQATGLGRMTEHFMRVGRYPADVFTGGWKILFWYVLPVGIIATLPAKIWFSMVDISYAAYTFFITIALFAAALGLWRHGLRHYQSASS